MHKIQAKTLHQEIANQIRGMIRNGILIKGQKIDEKYLCESMGVSRTPVRESLRILSSEGLIDLVPNRGAYISQPPIKEIKDMFEVMSVLEGTCARLATKKMEEKDFRKIEALHKKLENTTANRIMRRTSKTTTNIMSLFRNCPGTRSLMMSSMGSDRRSCSIATGSFTNQSDLNNPYRNTETF